MKNSNVNFAPFLHYILITKITQSNVLHSIHFEWKFNAGMLKVKSYKWTSKFWLISTNYRYVHKQTKNQIFNYIGFCSASVDHSIQVEWKDEAN